MEWQLADQPAQYLAAFVLGILAVLLIGGMLLTASLIGQRGRRTPAKDTPYECGMLPQGPGASRTLVPYHQVAMLFVLFDLEVMFLYPWAVIYRSELGVNPNQILGAMVAFVGILLVGYLYALKQGAFAWGPPAS